MTARLRGAALVVLVCAAVLGLWYAAAWMVQSGGGPVAAAKLPYPHQLAELFVEERAALLEATWITLKQAIVGFVIGSLVGLALSVVMVQAAWIEAALVPLLLAAQMIPMIALVPIAQKLFVNDDATRIFISAFITFFSVTIAAVRGLKSAPKESYELMASYRASRLDLFLRLQFPSAVSMLFSGLRVAAPLSLVGSILVDFTGAQSGLGYLMVAALTIGSSGAMIVWGAMLILLALGFLLTQVVVVAERVLAPWQPGLRRAAS
ncbi:ABC transporter permease [Streptomyces sp. 6N223]|uniref:ABC transporter permease n=1 Tax=Streptomyces sp. 6N223 TaxID=3457412 RepID=UPI003FD3EC02